MKDTKNNTPSLSVGYTVTETKKQESKGAIVIAINGKQGSGKSTLSSYLAEMFKREGFLVFKMKFADPLYTMHNAVRLGLSDYDPHNLLHMDYSKKDGDLLQMLGEWGRGKHENMFCNILGERARAAVQSRDNVVVLIDDLRFKNEVRTIKNYMGPRKQITVRLDCSEQVRKQRAEYWRKNTQHISEIDLDDYKEFDIILDSEIMSTAVLSREVFDLVGTKLKQQ